MTVIAVTRAGKGDAYAFNSVLMADAHPLIQYGDAIITDAIGLRQSLTVHECVSVAEKIGAIGLANEIRTYSNDSKAYLKEAMVNLWDKLIRLAPKPPTDPAVVFKLVVADRMATRNTGITIRPRGDFEMTKNTANHAPETEQGAAVTETSITETAVVATKKSPIPRDPKYADTGVITLLTDKDGKQYGKDHNPKKPGSASHERFTKYEDGMTVKAAKEAGLINGDIDNDVKKAYIAVV